MSDTGVLPLCEELRACRACLATDMHLEPLRTGHLADTYAELTGIQVLPADGWPQYVCILCAALLNKSLAFRKKCHNTHGFLQQACQRLRSLEQPCKVEIPMSFIRHLDRTYFKLPYTITDVLTISIPEATKVPVKQETKTKIEKEDSEGDCVLIEDCSDTKVLFVSEELRACRVCLATDVQLVALRPGHLADMYAELTGIPVLPTDGLSQHMCSMCTALLNKTVAFRSKCHKTHAFLQHVCKRLWPLGQPLGKVEILMSLIRHLDRTYFKLPYIITDVLSISVPKDATNVNNYKIPITKIKIDKEESVPVSIHEDATNVNKYEIPVKQVTKTKIEIEESEDDCVLLEDCKDDYIILEEEEPIDQFKKEGVFTSPVTNNDNAVLKLRSKSVEASMKNQKIEEYLIKSKEETFNINERLFYNYVLDKYFYKNKESGGADEYDIFDSNAGDNGIITTTALISSDICDISIDGNTVIDNAEFNKNMFSHYVREKYVNKSGKKQMSKIVDFIRWRINGVRLRTAKQREFQESRSKRDLEFAKTYNFDVIRMTRNEQILELQRRKNSPSYQQLTLKCEECYRGFRTETLYKKHMAMHDPISGSHVCEVCKQRFPTGVKLCKHRQKHTSNYVCRECKQIYKSSTLAREHSKTHAGVSYDCPHCDAKFRKYNTRVNHIRIHHGATQCDICYEGFQGANGLLMHKGKAHKQTYACASCDVHFDNAHAMIRHIGTSPDGACDPNIRACAKCGERFDTGEQFDEHVARLHAKTREKPREQKRKQRQRRKEQKEQARSRKEKTKWVKCCTCAHFEHGKGGGHKVPNSEYNVPTGDSCPCSKDDEDECLCPTGSERSCKLTEQGDPTDKADVFMRSKWAHKGCCKERRLMRSCVMCELCAAVFQSQVALRLHQRVHTREKPFQCNECHKQFRLKANLQIHIYTHTGERPYKCSLCPKAFRTNVNRQRHNLVHTQERRHRCEVCDKMFLTSTDVKTHVRTVHMKIPQPPRVRTRKRKCE